MRREGPVVLAQTNRFSAAVRKLLSIKGEEHDVGYGVHLEDERPEFSFLKTEYLFSQWHELTTVAGQFNHLGLRNPTGSGMLAVITSVFAECDTVGTLIQFGWSLEGTGALAVNGNVRMRDLRWARGTNRVSMSQLQYGSGTGGATFFLGIWTQLQTLAAGQPMDFTAAGGRVGSIVIPPGYDVYLATSVAGAFVMRATFNGYERPLESGELL